MKKIELKDILSLQNGYAFKSNCFNSENKGMPLIRISNIKENLVSNKDLVWISKEYIPNKNIYVSKGDLLIAMSGATTGKMGVYKGEMDCLLNQRVGKFCIKENNQIHRDYVIYILLSGLMQDEIVASSAGGAQPNISSKSIEKIRIPFPPLTEQKKIANILSESQDLIYKLERKKCKLENLLKATRETLFKYYFETGDLQRVKVVDLLKTKDLLLVQDGNHGEKHPKANQFIKNGTPFVMASHIKDGCFTPDQSKCLGKSVIKDLRIGHSFPGDVLLTHKGTIGEACIVPKNFKEIMLSPQVTMYRLSDHSLLTAELLKQFFSTLIFKKEILEMSGQSTRDYIGVKEQRNLHILFPKSNSIESNIKKPILSVQEQYLSITKKIYLHKNLLSALSQDLILGRKRVNV